MLWCDFCGGVHCSIDAQTIYCASLFCSINKFPYLKKKHIKKYHHTYPLQNTVCTNIMPVTLCWLKSLCVLFKNTLMKFMCLLTFSALCSWCCKTGQINSDSIKSWDIFRCLAFCSATDFFNYALFNSTLNCLTVMSTMHWRS